MFDFIIIGITQISASSLLFLGDPLICEFWQLLFIPSTALFMAEPSRDLFIPSSALSFMAAAIRAIKLFLLLDIDDLGDSKEAEIRLPGRVSYCFLSLAHV